MYVRCHKHPVDAVSDGDGNIMYDLVMGAEIRTIRFTLCEAWGLFYSSTLHLQSRDVIQKANIISFIVSCVVFVLYHDNA